MTIRMVWRGPGTWHGRNAITTLVTLRNSSCRETLCPLNPSDASVHWARRTSALAHPMYPEIRAMQEFASKSS